MLERICWAAQSVSHTAGGTHAQPLVHALARHHSPAHASRRTDPNEDAELSPPRCADVTADPHRVPSAGPGRVIQPWIGRTARHFSQAAQSTQYQAAAVNAEP